MGNEACISRASEEAYRFRTIHRHAGEEKAEGDCSQVASEKSMSGLVGSSTEEVPGVVPVLGFALGSRLRVILF